MRRVEPLSQATRAELCWIGAGRVPGRVWEKRGAPKRVRGRRTEQVEVVDGEVVPVLHVANVVLPDKDVPIVDVVGDRVADAAVVTSGGEASARAEVREAVCRDRLHDGAWKGRAEDIGAEARVPVVDIPFEPPKRLVLRAHLALGCPSAVSAVKVRLYEEAVERIGEAVADIVVVARQRPQSRLVYGRARVVPSGVRPRWGDKAAGSLS